MLNFNWYDHAQQIPNIGMGLKIIVDQIPDVMVIATGSSSFDLAGATGEPLTGRKTTIVLYLIAQQELLALYNRHELKEELEDFLSLIRLTVEMILVSYGKIL